MKKVLVIGTGSIAEKHIKNLLELNYKVSIYSESKNKIKKIKNLNYLDNLKKLHIFEFVILANATNKHLKYLKILIKNKKHIYCEKPIYFKKQQSDTNYYQNFINHNLSSVHIMGGVTSGENKECVVDSYGHFHGHKNLFVNDSSLINTKLLKNPQGTVLTIALRNIDYFLKNYS